VTLRVSARERDAVLEVEDTGEGLTTEDLEQLTQPFYSTKGRGSGMGLALVHRIVSDHGGSLEIKNRSAGGAHVTVILPGALTSVR
jgi:signal transduction histidine kinase